MEYSLYLKRSFTPVHHPQMEIDFCFKLSLTETQYLTLILTLSFIPIVILTRKMTLNTDPDFFHKSLNLFLS